jgi:hypothetical protein
MDLSPSGRPSAQDRAAGSQAFIRTEHWPVARHLHAPLTELASPGDEVIMSMAGHPSRAMLSRYSHVQMGAKRRALDKIAARQRAAEEERKEEPTHRHQTASTTESGAVQ